ncbi:MAG TPA: hypothetical protein PK047_06305 [Saprospiraceae bacterium]|jgi:hypothetical protein|nr:hypothetical protein [Saprospiraceae bacterium]HRO08462.1 hypothetical protein [Saprospiraceae bacterium]HRP41847.1 hypothetical protein [Saprospiraceae bacterium]
MKPIFPFFIILSMLSCAPSLVYYTDDINKKAGWSDEELQNIQFYLSDDIVLWNDNGSGNVSVTGGKIQMDKERNIEEVIIKKNTPGVFLFSPKKDHYAICFDKNDDSRYLVFGPSDKMNGRYVLLAKSWNNKTGKVTYGNKTYSTPATSAYANLLVNMKKSKTVRKSTNSPAGRKVN